MTVLSVTFAINLVFVIWAITGGTLPLAEENGVLENFQILLVSITFLTFAYGAVRGHGAVKSAAIGLAGLCVLVFLRELDLRNVAGPSWLIDLSAGPARDFSLACLASALLTYLVCQRGDAHGWIQLLARVEAWPLYLGAMLIAAGIMMDLFVVQNMQQRFCEEMLELNGYIMLLTAAIRHAVLLGRTNV